MMVDVGGEILRCKINNEKIQMKLVQRKIAFKTKQVKEYFDFLRKGKEIIQATTNDAEESLSDLEQSCLEVDELTADNVGTKLTHIPALAELPPDLPDTLDVEFPENQPSAGFLADREGANGGSYPES